MIWISIVLGFLSAAAWLLASIIPPSAPDSYYGGPPATVLSKYKWGTRLNAAGALLAALSMAAQAVSTLLSLG